MGVLTDFVAIDRSEAQRVCDSLCPSQDFAGIDAKGIDPVKLGALYALLTGTAFDPAFMGDDSLLAEGGDDGPWVMEVPEDLVQRLAGLNASQLDAIAAKWAQAEEFRHWSVAAVRDVLAELAKLCTAAATARHSVLMWMCL